MNRIDTNSDGRVNYSEFASKVRKNKEFPSKMRQRAQQRLSKMKQQMIYYMTSPVEAFRMVSLIPFGVSTFVFDSLTRLTPRP